MCVYTQCECNFVNRFAHGLRFVNAFVCDAIECKHTLSLHLSSIASSRIVAIDKFHSKINKLFHNVYHYQYCAQEYFMLGKNTRARTRTPHSVNYNTPLTILDSLVCFS